jgi:hypothetical protein
MSNVAAKLKEENEKLREYLSWALSIIDENFKETGKIGFAEVIVYRAAKSYLKKDGEE